MLLTELTHLAYDYGMYTSDLIAYSMDTSILCCLQYGQFLYDKPNKLTLLTVWTHPAFSTTRYTYPRHNITHVIVTVVRTIMLAVVPIRTINTSYNQTIYKTSNKNFVDGNKYKKIYKYTCVLFMKLPVMTCLKLFVSNTLYNSSCKFYIYLLSFVFDLKYRLYR